MNLLHKYKTRFGAKKVVISIAIVVLVVLNLSLLVINNFYEGINPKSSSEADNGPVQSNLTLPFVVNDNVQTKTPTDIRRTPPLLEVNISSSVPQGTQGKIISGPTRAANTWWWQVDFGNNNKGWVPEEAIALTGTHANYVIATPTLNPSQTDLGMQAPKITLDGVRNGSFVNKSLLTVSGTVSDNVSAPSQLSLFINNHNVPLSKDGKFTVRLQLNSGFNNFTMYAQGPTNNPAQQMNDITSYIDASVVYGSDPTRAADLRTFQNGMLKTSAGNLPSFNTEGLPNANDAHIVPDDQIFLAGDVRGNENDGLSAMQTLFLREHNTIAGIIKKEHPNLNDEQIYQWARRIVIAEIQSITYNEFLPALFGPDAPGQYKGYDQNVNAGTSNEFAAGAYRLGHSMIDTDIHFFDNNDKDTVPAVPLQNAFFNPKPIEQYGVDGILKYFTGDNEQEIDPLVIDALRNFLFGPPGAGGFDLASLNVQRGRDHGMPDYNTTRKAFGLPAVTSFSQITKNAAVAAKLQKTYGNVNNIDLWEGGLAEDHLPGTDVGPTFAKIIVDQFERSRDGDRYWYQNLYSGRTVAAIQAVNLADVIRRNTTITNLQDNVFHFTEGKTVMNNVSQSDAMAKLVTLVNTIPQPNPRDYESIDGSNNNRQHPTWGQAGTDFLRLAPVGYADGISTMGGTNRPSARVASNNINTLVGTPDDFASDTMANMVWGWGQFMDHDLDHSVSGTTPASVQVPAGDQQFDPKKTGKQTIPLDRDSTDPATGNGITKTTTLNFHLFYLKFFRF